MTAPEAVTAPAPRLRRHLRATSVADEGTFVVCEHGAAVVATELGRRLVPMLDGRPLTQIVAAMADQYAEAAVVRAVDGLRTAGHVIDADPAVPVDEAGYWDSAGLHGDEAYGATAATVPLHVVGDLDAAGALASLRSAGLRVRPPAATGPDGPDAGGPDPAGGSGPSLHVVLTDDYLSPELDELALRLQRAGQAWLPAKPVGVRVLVGPVFEPGGACYACLTERLRGHRLVEQYLADRVAPDRVAVARVATPASRAFAYGVVATVASQWLAGYGRHEGAVTDAVLRVVDTLSMRIDGHPVVRRPQCTRCGDPQVTARRMAAPVRLGSRTKGFTTDGGHRARSPEDMLAAYGHLVDPVTGVVPELTPLTTRLPFVRSYSAGANRAMRLTSLSLLREGLRAQSCGKGMTDVQARASALGEALERHSGVHAGDEPRVTASLAALGDDAVHPNDCMLYSDRQYDERDAWNEERIPFQMVPERLDPAESLEWTPVWSLTEQRHKYLPTSMLFFGHRAAERRVAWADSNGNAAGTSPEDAVLQGFYELVERDGVAIWWYNRLRRRGIDLDAMGDPWVDQLRREHAALNREVWALELTTGLGVPVVAAVSRRVDKPAEDILFAFGAHHDARLAVQRALAELNQFLPAVAFSTADGSGYDAVGPELLRWWQGATIAEHPYLLPDPDLPAAHVDEMHRPAPDDLGEHVEHCRRLVEGAGMEMLVIDMTRPDIGLPVVKVIVPGMRHFWARFGPGRLYTEPVHAGHRTGPVAESELNPVAMFV